MNSITRIVVLFTLVFSIISCDEDPTQLGEDLLPPSDDFVLSADSSTIMSASMIPYDTIVSHYSSYNYTTGTYADSDTLNLLGDYYDNVFGRKTADLTLYFLPAFKSLGVGAVKGDSLVIYFKVSSVLTGDPKANLSYKVYQLTKPINTTDTIYSYSNLAKDTANHKVGEGIFNFNSNLVRISVTDTNLIAKLAQLSETDSKDSIFVNKILNGFYVNVEKKDPNGAVALITTGYSNYSTTKMTFYYKKDAKDTSVNFYTGGYYYNNKAYDYNGAFTLKTDITNSLVQTETDHVLIQGLLGSSAKLDLQSPAETWKDSGVIAINKVELIIEPTKDVLSSSITEAKYPSRLEMYYKIKQSNGKIGKVPIATSSFTNGAYRFNISSHYQNLIRKRVPYSSIYIKDYSTVYSAGVFAFDKAGATKLKIVYSKLK